MVHLAVSRRLLDSTSRTSCCISSCSAKCIFH
nr:MAG TPA: hypothetical protein [Caudoviricetes sp.]